MELPQRPLTIVITGLVILVALASLWFRFYAPPPKIDRLAGDAIAVRAGKVLAEETVKVIHDRGRIVLVTDHEDLRGKSFRNELAQHGSISLIATEYVQPDVLERTVCSSAAFKRLLEQYAQADAIIFLTGLPEWSKVEPVIAGQTIAPKIVALDEKEAFFLKRHYGGYFSKGILSALIAHKPEAAPTDPYQSPREWFDRHYQVYTPDNDDSLHNAGPPVTPRRPPS